MTLASAAAGSIPLPFADVAIVMNILATAIIKIGKAYGYVWKKISKDDLFSIFKGELYQKKIVLKRIIIIWLNFLKLLEKYLLKE